MYVDFWLFRKYFTHLETPLLFPVKNWKQLACPRHLRFWAINSRNLYHIMPPMGSTFNGLIQRNTSVTRIVYLRSVITRIPQDSSRSVLLHCFVLIALHARSLNTWNRIFMHFYLIQAIRFYTCIRRYVFTSNLYNYSWWI